MNKSEQTLCLLPLFKVKHSYSLIGNYEIYLQATMIRPEKLLRFYSYAWPWIQVLKEDAMGFLHIGHEFWEPRIVSLRRTTSIYNPNGSTLAVYLEMPFSARHNYSTHIIFNNIPSPLVLCEQVDVMWHGNGCPNQWYLSYSIAHGPVIDLVDLGPSHAE